ncbi:cardiolipin synthase [Winogradskyella alexanderae]|uniref:Cardiolipin synthase n=1 Tax=Winogradskyella alexanderae TaxID=2877123 RepID=A0ABS7XQE8_9FLAO|nr:cardiolipin synthase [Winogradskyella alexanderae]MCA0132223.1 cardiolipin synthase [Winogradskyella alexanderae]
MEFVKDNFIYILFGLNYFLALLATITLLFQKINPTKTLTYIIVLLVFPFVGLLVYYFFGQDYRKTKIFNRKHVLNQSVIAKIQNELEIDTQAISEVDELLEEKSKLIRLLYNSQSSKLTLKNDVQVICNGDEKLRLLLEDLKTARNHIHLEYFIIKDDETGTEVLNLLSKKAEEGVEVKIIIDDVGSKISNGRLSSLRKSGVIIYKFMPVLFSRFTGRMNYRDHRKILIVDGKIGYVGGINISNNYINSRNQRFWKDTHLRIAGEAVHQLQILFFTTWDFVSQGELQIREAHFPRIDIESKIPLQIAASGPDTDWSNIMESIFVAINNAEDFIYITTPYFIPNDEIVTALQVASRSNIKVKIIIPKKSDSWIAEYATNSYIEKLLEASVEVYQYHKGFVHSKTMIVDDVFCTVGTANMDYRSFNINFEVNALIYNRLISSQIKAMFNEDLKNSKKVEPNEWERRSNKEKFLEGFARLMAPLL